MTTPTFAALLRRHRDAQGLSQAALAKRARLNEETVRELERFGKRPRPATVGLLADALGLDDDQRAAFRAAVGGHAPAAGPPAAPEAPRPRGHLRRAPDSFLGRDTEVAAVRLRLRTHGLVTLTGPGGVGKTRLAVEAAHGLTSGPGDVAGSSGSYPDGVWLTELGALTDADLVPQVIAAAVGVDLAIGDRPADALAEALGERRLLLVLDNCEHLVGSCAEVVEALLGACPGVRVLATSREPLGCAGETVVRVASLAVPPSEGVLALAEVNAAAATCLFVDRASEVAPGFVLTGRNASAVAEVCRRLDGIPLALEFAARLVRGLPVEEIAARLDDRFRLLTGGRRSALSRQQTLRALVDWSYELLAPSEQALFVRLCIFAGPFTLEAAEAVSIGADDGTAGAVLMPLLRLVDTSFVLADDRLAEDEETAPLDMRYRLLETLREYGRERSAADAAEAARLRGRHLAYHLELVEAVAETSGERRLLALRRLDAARDDLWVAFGWARDGADASASRRLDRALVRLVPTVTDSPVRHALGPLLAEARRLGLSAYAAFRRGLLEQTDPDVLAAGVTLYWVIGDHEAQSLLLGRLEEVEQEPGAADRVVLRRARLHLLHDGVSEGLALLDDVERSALTRGDEELLLDVRLERGYAHTHTGDCARGGRAYDDALALLERLRPGLPPTAYLERRLVAVRGRGFVAHNADDNVLCAACQREAHALADALGDGPERVRALHNLADAQYGCGDYGGALRTFRRAQAASVTASFALVRLGCATGTGIVLGAVGRTEEALAVLQEGLDAARALGDAWWIAYGLAHLSAVRAARGELEAALDASREAVALAARHGVGYPLILARTHLLWQQVLASPGHPARAAEIAAARAAAEALGLQGLAVFLTWVGLLHRVADPTVADGALAGELATGITLYRARAPLKGSWETLALRVREGAAACRPGVALVDLDALVDEVVAQKAESLDLEEREAFRASRRARTVSLTAWRGR